MAKIELHSAVHAAFDRLNRNYNRDFLLINLVHEPLSSSVLKFVLKFATTVTATLVRSEGYLAFKLKFDKVDSWIPGALMASVCCRRRA